VTVTDQRSAAAGREHGKPERPLRAFVAFETPDGRLLAYTGTYRRVALDMDIASPVTSSVMWDLLHTLEITNTDALNGVLPRDGAATLTLGEPTRQETGE
jgi:hypothetical protein